MRARIAAIALMLGAAVLGAQAPKGQPAPKAAVQPPFSIVEATIPEMRAAMEQGR